MDDLLLYLHMLQDKISSLCLVLLYRCNYIHYYIACISILLHVLNFGFVADVARASGRS